jgi:DNA-binding NarL/FixJ family response regulator
MSQYAKKRFLVIDDQPQARDAAYHRPDHRRLCRRIRHQLPGRHLPHPQQCAGHHPVRLRARRGRSGQQLLEELRRFNLLADESIFMMVTGEQSYEQVVSAVELVPDDYIIKPFSPDKLVLRLDRIMARRSSSRSTTRKSAKEYAAALAILEAQRNSEAGRPYRFEILRQRPKCCSIAAIPRVPNRPIAAFWRTTNSPGPAPGSPAPCIARTN